MLIFRRINYSNVVMSSQKHISSLSNIRELNLTQRKRAQILALQRDCLLEYLEVCHRLNEVPRPIIYTLIAGCFDTEALLDSRFRLRTRIQTL